MAHSYQHAIQRARSELREALLALASELRDYPTPVSGCDLYYTQLLSEHRKVSAALTALGTNHFVPTPRTLAEGAGIESR